MRQQLAAPSAGEGAPLEAATGGKKIASFGFTCLQNRQNRFLHDMCFIRSILAKLREFERFDVPTRCGGKRAGVISQVLFQLHHIELHLHTSTGAIVGDVTPLFFFSRNTNYKVLR